MVTGNPLLIFPQSTASPRLKIGGGGPSKVRFPSREQQRERLTPQFAALETAFASRRAEIQADPAGVIPEQVLVLETIGTIDNFMSAVRLIPGMEWLGEWEDEDVPSDEYFYHEGRQDKELPGRITLIMSNQEALGQLLSLWRLYDADRSSNLGYGKAKFKDLFRQLRVIRSWDVQDRLLSTGVLKEWEQRVTLQDEVVEVEVELWYRTDVRGQQIAENVLRHLIEAEGGHIVGSVVLDEISYHSILAELPIQSANTIINSPNTQLVRCGHVMFFRSTGQVAVSTYQEMPQESREMPAEITLPEGGPIAAILDGFPMENHQLLSGRLNVDDPDSWASDCPVANRRHGTAIASLVIHGDLDSHEPPLTHRIYMRPILKPDMRDFSQDKAERVPETVLPVDLVHRAVLRMFEGEGGSPPVANSVRIVNLSVGDSMRPFMHSLSPWAKLLDWLSWKYKILFIVSAGNYPTKFVLSIPPDILVVESDTIKQAMIKAIAMDAHNRRILAPAETINALTVGALHSDASTISQMGMRTDLFSNESLPSPISALGPGFRRSIKPEILFPGGRQLFMETQTHHYIAHKGIQPPGQAVAAPSQTGGNTSQVVYTRGTSNAAALATRAAAQIYESLYITRQSVDGYHLDENYASVLIKALLVHSASWGNSSGAFTRALKTPTNSFQFKEHISRYFGYGVADVNRIMSCTDSRATVIGYGLIGNDEARIFSFPLPASLNGTRVKKRLTITLAWVTPTNPHHKSYRSAALSFAPPSDTPQVLGVKRKEANYNAAKRGTVQHEILEGTAASSFINDRVLEIAVNCREDAGSLQDLIPFALIVSLEEAEGIGLPIYQQVRSRLQVSAMISYGT